MSSTFLKIISTNPSFVLDQGRVESARTFLYKFYQKTQIEFVTTDTIEFVDQGENFESVRCNLCGIEMETETWQNAMDSAYKDHFEDLSFITGCCNKKTALNNLEYNWPAGFARSVISISGPQNGLTEKDLEELANVVGSQLKIIRAKY